METTNKIKEASLRTYETLGCRDFARLDFRVNKRGEPYFLEINPLPGLDPINSDLVIMANKVGLSYEELISRILNSTLQRINKATVPK
jgi:D-alanine-D-alanine ligase